MEKLTTEQIANWRGIMSTMGMSMISSIVSDKEVEGFAESIQRQIDQECEKERVKDKLINTYRGPEVRTIQESNRKLAEEQNISGFRNNIRVVKGK